MRMTTNIFATLVAIAPLAGAAVTAAVAGDTTCFPDWTAAVPVVEREALTAVRELHSLARQRQMGDVLRVTLCAENDRYVYRLLVREPKGQVVSMTVDARRPFTPDRP